jgi:hypothetical protein
MLIPFTVRMLTVFAVVGLVGKGGRRGGSVEDSPLARSVATALVHGRLGPEQLVFRGRPRLERERCPTCFADQQLHARPLILIAQLHHASRLLTRRWARLLQNGGGKRLLALVIAMMIWVSIALAIPPGAPYIPNAA